MNEEHSSVTQENRAHLQQQASSYIENKQWALAQEVLIELLSHDNNDQKMLYAYMTTLDGVGQYEALLEQAQQTLEKYPNDAYAHAFKARALQKLEAFSEATIANDQALLLDTNLSLAWINRSGLQLLQRKFTEALRSSQRAVDLAPHDARSWANRGVALLNFGRLLDALYAFEQGILCDPSNIFSRNMKSDVLLQLGRWNEAVINARETIAIDPTNLDAHTFAMNGLRALENFEELGIVAKELAHLDPEDFNAWENYIRAMRGTGNFEEAHDAFKYFFKLDWGDPRMWTLKADTLYRLQRYQEAVADADEAIALDPEYAPAHRIREKSLKLMYQRKKR